MSPMRSGAHPLFRLRDHHRTVLQLLGKSRSTLDFNVARVPAGEACCALSARIAQRVVGGQKYNVTVWVVDHRRIRSGGFLRCHLAVIAHFGQLRVFRVDISIISEGELEHGAVSVTVGGDASGVVTRSEHGVEEDRHTASHSVQDESFLGVGIRDLQTEETL
jgi:hypothetical protein